MQDVRSDAKAQDVQPDELAQDAYQVEGVMPEEGQAVFASVGHGVR